MFSVQCTMLSVQCKTVHMVHCTSTNHRRSACLGLIQRRTGMGEGYSNCWIMYLTVCLPINWSFFCGNILSNCPIFFHLRNNLSCIIKRGVIKKYYTKQCCNSHYHCYFCLLLDVPNTRMWWRPSGRRRTLREPWPKVNAVPDTRSVVFKNQ